MVASLVMWNLKQNDSDSSHLLGQKFTESNMNPSIKGREMRKAFDSDDFQVMIVANKLPNRL